MYPILGGRKKSTSPLNNPFNPIGLYKYQLYSEDRNWEKHSELVRKVERGEMSVENANEKILQIRKDDAEYKKLIEAKKQVNKPKNEPKKKMTIITLRMLRERYMKRKQELFGDVIVISQSLKNKVEDLLPYVLRIQNFKKPEEEKVKKYQDLPFKLNITNPISNTTQEFNFNNYYHFENWYKQIVKNETTSDSFRVIEYATLMKEANISDLARVDFITEYGGGSGNENTDIVRDGKFYKFTMFNPEYKHNNCAFKVLEQCFNIKISYTKERKELGLLSGIGLTLEQFKVLYDKYNNTGKPCILVMNIDTDILFDFTKNNYFMVNNQHLLYIKSVRYNDVIPGNSGGCGLLFWDVETRPTDNTMFIQGQESKIIEPTILCAYYRRWRHNEWKRIKFITNEVNCVRQFQDWLIKQHFKGKHYFCYAHNSSRFDNYFFLKYLSPIEQMESRQLLRGLSIIKLIYRGHWFMDTCCFLTSSLSNLCKSFKVDKGKLTELELYGNKISNENLCFYKPELNFDEFMKLQDNEPEFWNLYEEYCFRDCEALKEVWMSFRKCNDEILSKMFKMDPQLTNELNMCESCTIGSYALKVWKKSMCLTPKGDKFKKVKENDEDSCLMYNYNYCQYLKFGYDDTLINFFVRQCLRGGISLCQKEGVHNEPIVSYDITSQYPASAINMKVPVGESRVVHKYDRNLHGFYRLKNLKFRNDGLEFRPISVDRKKEGLSLQWITGSVVEELYTTSYMIDYLINYYGLYDFEVVVGYVSDKCMKGYYLFNNYFSTCFEMKNNQDELKENKDPSYNPALRETIKLMMNCLTGKLCEDTSNYKSLDYYKFEENKNSNWVNGLPVINKLADEDRVNKFIGLSVCLLDYSKRLLFEYIRCVGNENIIAVETDSMYFPKKYEKQFIDYIKGYVFDKEDPYCVKIGNKLGNMKNEVDTDKTSYFFGKKFYCIEEGDGEFKIACKGIPEYRTCDDGSKEKVISVEDFKALCNGEDRHFKFTSLKKTLFTQSKTAISQLSMTRTIKGKKLPVYN